MVNAVCTAPGWIEWSYQKMNVRHLKSSGMTQGVLDYLMWHHFGKVSALPTSAAARGPPWLENSRRWRGRHGAETLTAGCHPPA